MSRTAILNIILGAIASSLVTILVVLEWRDATETAPTTTTTTTTTTTVPPTSTSTTTSSTSTTSTVPASTTTTLVAVSDEPPVTRFFVAVLVVNGSTAGERLEPAQSRLRDAGYGSVRGVSGVALTQETVFYVLDETWVDEGRIVAADLGFDPDDVTFALFDDAPPVAGVLDAKVIVYLGPDPLPELPIAPADADPDAENADG